MFILESVYKSSFFFIVFSFVSENEHGYESYDSEYDSEPYNHRPKPRNFERERKRDRNRNKEARRDRKNFREKNNRKKEEQTRPQMQDSGNICMFYMQGKCHKVICANLYLQLFSKNYS